MHSKDEIIIRMMGETIGKIFQFTSDLESAEAFEKDVESFDATIMNFIVLGESVGKLSKTFKEEHPNIEWRKFMHSGMFWLMIILEYIPMKFGKSFKNICQN